MKKNRIGEPQAQGPGCALKGEAKHLRKGIVGDWKRHFSSTENVKFNNLIRSRLAAAPALLDCWKEPLEL